MPKPSVHRIRSFVVSALRTADDALTWAVSPVPASVKNWLTVLFLGVTLLGVGLSYIYVVPSLQNRLVNQKLTALSGSTLHVAQEVAGVAGQVGPTPANLKNAATFGDALVDARVVVIDSRTGKTLADSRAGLPLNVAAFRVVAQAERTGTLTDGPATVGETEYATAAVPVTVSTTGFHAIVLVSTPLNDLQRAVRSVQHEILLAGGIALIVTLFAVS